MSYITSELYLYDLVSMAAWIAGCSALLFYIVGLGTYVVGVIVNSRYKGDDDSNGFLAALTVLAFVIALISGLTYTLLPSDRTMAMRVLDTINYIEAKDNSLDKGAVDIIAQSMRDKLDKEK
ncbi:MAG: hypothetical protein [Bacteriophage sp.]|nr:MAG: hypothetical protein [Bacteriophage sp.]